MCAAVTTAHHLSSQTSAEQRLDDQETCMGHDALRMHVSHYSNKIDVAMFAAFMLTSLAFSAQRARKVS